MSRKLCSCLIWFYTLIWPLCSDTKDYYAVSYANCRNPDKPARTHCRISAFDVHLHNHWILKNISADHISLNIRKRTFGYVRPVKIQIYLHIRTVKSESLLVAFWIGKDAKCLHADSEDSDQTARMCKLT